MCSDFFGLAADLASLPDCCLPYLLLLSPVAGFSVHGIAYGVGGIVQDYLNGMRWLRLVVLALVVGAGWWMEPRMLFFT